MDEAGLRASHGKVRRHPLVSTVVYLAAGSSQEQPTLITKQRFGSVEGYDSESERLQSQQSGWLVFPAENRLCFFDGELLHGVVPGTPGSSHAAKDAAVPKSGDGDGGAGDVKRMRREGGDAGTADTVLPCGGLRTTLMIGWWAQDPTEMPTDELGPNMTSPFPVPVDAFDAEDEGESSDTRPPTWPSQFQVSAAVKQEIAASTPHSSTIAPVHCVSNVWHRIPKTIQGFEPPTFPTTGDVVFFGRVFLDSLGQVDQEIMVGFEDGPPGPPVAQLEGSRIPIDLDDVDDALE